MSNALGRHAGKWTLVDTSIAVIGVSIGLILAVVVAPRSTAQAAAVAGTSITASGQSNAERAAASATLLVQSQECTPLRGTGTVLRSGLVLTNAHVLGGGTSFDVVTTDGRQHTTGRAQRSTDTDLASGSLPPGVPVIGLDLASHDPRPGDQVVIAGHPGGGPLRVRTASVVGARPGEGPDDPPMIIRLDLHLMPGESGSPIVGQDGRLVGIAYSSERGTDQALVIPASRIRHALADVRTATSRC
jgi:S1-C subfamily serine protease